MPHVWRARHRARSNARALTRSLHLSLRLPGALPPHPQASVAQHFNVALKKNTFRKITTKGASFACVDSRSEEPLLGAPGGDVSSGVGTGTGWLKAQGDVRPAAALGLCRARGARRGRRREAPLRGHRRRRSHHAMAPHALNSTTAGRLLNSWERSPSTSTSPRRPSPRTP
jgi:hypothetical protein